MYVSVCVRRIHEHFFFLPLSLNPNPHVNREARDLSPEQWRATQWLAIYTLCTNDAFCRRVYTCADAALYIYALLARFSLLYILPAY